MHALLRVEKVSVEAMLLPGLAFVALYRLVHVGCLRLYQCLRVGIRAAGATDTRPTTALALGRGAHIQLREKVCGWFREVRFRG